MQRLIYEDRAMLVWRKLPGEDSERLPAQLCEELRMEGLRPVHRLDKPVGGLLVLAKSPEAAAALSAQLQSREACKGYLAVLRGVPEEAAGVLEDLLFYDRSRNKSFVVRRMRAGVKKARLSYRVLETRRQLSLVAVRLETGRTHQIRVQFSSRGLPLAGDGRYGGKDAQTTAPALLCAYVSVRSPDGGRPVRLFARPEAQYPWNLFTEGLQEDGLRLFSDSLGPA